MRRSDPFTVVSPPDDAKTFAVEYRFTHGAFLPPSLTRANDAVFELRKHGASWRNIAGRLGISVRRAQKLHLAAYDAYALHAGDQARGASLRSVRRSALY